MGSETGLNPEFSFVVRPSEIGEKEQVYEFEADSLQCEALARRFDLVEIESLRVRMAVIRHHGGATLRLLGRVRAGVTQRCVVTLEPVKSDVDHRLESIFSVEDQSDSGDMMLSDEIEPLEGDVLDLGEVAAEELFLALDPYPRVVGVALTDFIPEADPGENPKHPFAALAALKGKK
ncbi:MAG: DUF177 domain-containing protein [Proteobacteria bacterium]|nr:DUF177 domain-containing protein [Pseudomonadota bacterium]